MRISRPVNQPYAITTGTNATRKVPALHANHDFNQNVVKLILLLPAYNRHPTRNEMQIFRFSI